MSCEKHPPGASCAHTADSFCIQSVPVFSGLTDEEAARLQQITYSRHYAKGDFIFQEGEPSRTLYVVHEGLIKISKVSDEGREQIIRLLFPGDFFGQFSLLGNKQHYANAEVLEPVTVCQISKEDFIPILERNPEMTLRFMFALSERLQQADEWISTIGLMEVERRLAKALLLYYRKNQSEQPFHLPVPKKDFAALIGTTPETLSRKLVHFESLNLLKLTGRKGIEVLDLKGLEELAGNRGEL